MVPLPWVTAVRATPDAAAFGALVRAWTAVATLHPALASGLRDWSLAFAGAVNALLAGSPLHVVSAGMCAHLADPSTAILEATNHAPDPWVWPGVAAHDYRPSPQRHGDIAIVSARKLLPLHGNGGRIDRALASMLDESTDARRIVLDLRGTTFFVARALHEQLPRVLRGRAELPSVRSRCYSGIETPWWRVEPSGVLDGDGPGVELVIVLDRDAHGLQLASGLQVAGLATVVVEGDVHPAPGGHSIVPLGCGLELWMPAGELIFPDGTTNWRPDAVAADGLSEALRGIDPSPQQRRPAMWTIRSPSVTEPPPGTSEAGARLISLGALWSAVANFFPYHDLTDEPWDGLLERFIPRILDTDEPACVLAELLAASGDSHALLTGAGAASLRGTAFPDVAVRTIDGACVVMHGDPATGLEPGDVVTTVDGEPVASLRERHRPRCAASTPHALELRLDRLLLAGPERSEARLARRDSEVRVARYLPAPPHVHRHGPTWQILPTGAGYVDLTRLEPNEVGPAFACVASTGALVLDLRGYPRGTGIMVASRLCERTVPYARIATPVVAATPGSGTWRRHTAWEQTTEMLHPVGPPYTGRLAVLIDEHAISQAEHTCLALRAARPDATFVGSPTTGANGRVSWVTLPGEVRALFSGQRVVAADGSQLQRRGILPDVWVRPTLEGIRAGRDEVLEAALAALPRAQGRA